MNIAKALLLFFVLSASESLATGILTFRLEQAMREAAPVGQQIRALVYLEAQVDIPSLDREMYSQRVSPQERAFRVITTLQNRAEQTQGPLLAHLASRTPMEIARYEAFWVANMIMIEATAEAITEIARREDVRFIDLDAELLLDRPVESNPAPESIPNGTEPGLRAVNAPRLWALGYTGAGRIVMNIDTGVNGNHPALNYKWRGTHVPASQAWFDPVSGTSFPNDCDGHGTHTAGIMNGLDPATNDTVGMAPGAEWIASNSLCSGGAHTSNSIASFQWAMDPDGNPATTDDMPDAIGNSWYDPSATDCANSVYRQVFDAVEATGIAIVFSAGNNGPGGSTITVPKNINTNLVNVFAIGAVDGNTPSFPIASFSSRGPSTCGGMGSLLIKPEVSAPGVSVRSSYGISGNGYSFLSGTSMACPHVVGAIALLREAFPQFTGYELKLALYNTAIDLGATGEDNAYGTGIIDVYEAFISLGVPNPPANFSAYSDYQMPTSIQLTWEDPTNFANGDTLLQGNYTLYLSRDGVLLDSLDGGIEQFLDQGLVEGQEYEYEIYTSLDTSTLASRPVSISWTAGGARQPSAPPGFSLSGNQNQITVRWTNPATNIDGTPMVDFGGINLYQDNLLAGTFTRAASDTASADSMVYAPQTAGYFSWHLTAFDTELPQQESPPTMVLATPLALPVLDGFVAEGAPNPALWVTTNGEVSSRSNNPPSPPYALNLNSTPTGRDTVEMRQLDLSSYQGTGAIFAYSYQPQGNGDSPESGDSLKLYFKNDLGAWVEIRGYPGAVLRAFEQEVIDIASAPNAGGSFFHSQFQVRFTSEGSISTIPRDDWFVDNVYLGLPGAVIASSQDTVSFDTTLVGSNATATLSISNAGTEDLLVSDVVSTNPSVFSVDTTNFTISPNSSLTVTVTFTPDHVGLNTGILQFVSNDLFTDTLSIVAEGVGGMVTSTESETELPRRFAVSPNFPNPFNPSTTIQYELPVKSHVELVVYTLLGGRVSTLVSEEKEAGYYSTQWSGTNDAGIAVTSGVYVYRFAAGTYQVVRKMILLK